MLIQVRRDTAANFTSANPTLSAGEWAFETDSKKVKIGDGSTAWTSLQYFAPLPYHWATSLSALVGVVTAGNSAIAFANGNGPGAGFWYQSTAANGDTMEWTFPLDAGTYKLTTVVTTGNNRGIVKWQIDGADVRTGNDLYSASDTPGVITSTTGITVTAGLKTLRYVVTGKNGSSSNYLVAIQAIALVRTGA
jgi:hypothetical protein